MCDVIFFMFILQSAEKYSVGYSSAAIRVPKIWDTRIYDFGFTIYELRISG